MIDLYNAPPVYVQARQAIESPAAGADKNPDARNDHTISSALHKTDDDAFDPMLASLVYREIVMPPIQQMTYDSVRMFIRAGDKTMALPMPRKSAFFFPPI